MTMTKQEKAKEFEKLIRDWNFREYYEELTDSYYSGNHPELKFIIDMPIEDQCIWLKRAMDEYEIIKPNFDVFCTTPWMLVKMTLERRKKRKMEKLSKECPLNRKTVMDIFMDCMFKENPKTGAKFIPVIGVHANVGFDPDKINKHKDEIINLLNFLPDEFSEADSVEERGGWSLLKAPFTKYSTQWGEQIDADRLFMLGMAIGKVKYILPRELWFMFPGGVPYYVILNECEKVELNTVQ